LDKALETGMDAPAIARSVPELRSEGSAALQRGDADAAEALYRALLARDPKDIYGLVGLGLAAKVRGRREEALQCLKAAVAAWPTHPWPLLELGSIFRSCDRPKEAETALRRALELDPRHSHALLALGGLLAQRGDHAEAVELYRVAASLAPPNAKTYSALASTLARMGSSDEAIAALSAGLEAVTDKYTLWCAKARLLRTLSRNDEAMAAWNAALSEKPDQLLLKLEIASETCALGMHADALSAYRNIMEDKRIADAQRHQAALAGGRIARDKLRDGPAAIAFFEQAAALNADHLQGACELAQQYRMAKRFDDAEDLYRKVLAREPENVAALAGFATLKRLAGEVQEALPLIEKACAINPKQDWNRLEFGYVLRDVGRVEEAAAKFETIESDSPALVPALMALGQIARARGDNRSAGDYFEQAAGRASNPTDALRNFAEVRSAMGDFPAAEEAIARLLAHDPTSYGGHMAKGSLKRAMNDRPGAREAFLGAAEIAPASPQPLVEIAVEELIRGNVKTAAAALETALKIDPVHQDALLKKGALLARQGENLAALAIYRQLQTNRPDAASSYLAAAELMATMGESHSALEKLTTARERCRPNSQIDFKEASILRQLGRLDQSLEMITAAGKAFPRDFWPWYLRTSMSIDLGCFDEAETLLAEPPPLPSDRERGHVFKLRAGLLKARWALEAAIEALDAAVELDPKDGGARIERAKLELMIFDLPGAWRDLVGHAEARSPTVRRKINPMHSHTGQLYEEYILDGALAEKLAALRGTPPQEQIGPLARLVRDFPDSTGPAIGLTIALRRCGRFAPPRSGDFGDGLTPAIPRLITRFWNDPEPPSEVAQLMASWNECEPSFRIETFNDSTALNYLRARCAPQIADAFGRAGEPAQRADLFRLARIHNEGGYFIDADDRARGGLSAHVPPRATFFAHQEDPGSIGNNVLGATPHHPVIQRALNEAAAAILRGDRDIIWLTTGPGLLTRAFANWLANEPERLSERLSTVAILTLAEIRRAAAIHCQVAYKRTERAWLSGAFGKKN
jgi:tetratricopeptide (TPR) repeat protein